MARLSTLKVDLEDLKRTLLDLDNPDTKSLELTPGRPGATDVVQALQSNRQTGHDWPLEADTMIGKERLDDLQWCVEQAVRDSVPGDLIEAGAWRGGACMLMRAVLNELGEKRTVCVADSFAGFRPNVGDDWEHYLAAYGHLIASLEAVRARFRALGLEDGVEFVPGYFEDTLPLLQAYRWSLIRSDADTYSATRFTLEELERNLNPGGFVIVDDYHILEPVRRAVDDYRAMRRIDAALENCDSWNAVRWRKPPA